MTFVNLSLLAGTALVALPIVLHLIMRRRPKLLEFPALRFIQKRHDMNRRRLRLRHLVLLLLRAGAIALLALALARPSVKLASAVGSQEAPVAAALVFDAAPRMEYRHENRTRLEAGRELGQWLLAQLPEQSEIAVVDTRLGSTAAFAADRGAAKERIARLETVSNSQPLPVAIESAVKLLRQSKLERKEVYIFTDLSRGAWPEEQQAALQQRLSEAGGVGVYVLDVGAANPTDYGLGQVRLSGEVLSNRSRLSLSVPIGCIGPAAPKIVELYLLDADRKPQKSGQQNGEAVPGELRPVDFQVSDLGLGIHQGFVRILGQDGLAADDTRYFTVAVRPAWRLLVVAPNTPHSYARFLTDALAPPLWRKLGQARFDCDVWDGGELAKRPLADYSAYSAICLLDPTRLEPATWKKLVDFAAEGRGVAIFLGRNAAGQIDSFNDTESQKLLPGKLLRQARRPDGDLHLAPRDYQHPILSAFRSSEGAIPWEYFPVFRYWELGERTAGTSVVASYNDGRPAILERTVGRGRALTMTTPVSDRPNDNPWNLLPIPALDPWPYVILVNQMMEYLVGSTDQQLNYLAGQTVVLQVDAAAERRAYMLFMPGGLSLPIPSDLSRRDLPIPPTEEVGNYRVQAGGHDGSNLGFSVNYAPEQTRLDRLSDEELSGVFGPVKFRLARTREQIDRDISMSRVGRELYPPLILFVAVVLGLEMLVANRFYRE